MGKEYWVMLNASKLLPKSLLKHTQLKKKQCITFWKNRLGEIDQLDLSFLKFKSNYNFLSSKQQFIELSIEESDSIGNIKFSFDNEILINLQKLNSNLKINPVLFAQSILAFLLNKHSGQERFCISYSCAIKNRADLFYGNHCSNIMLYDFSEIHNITDIINQSTQFLESLKWEEENHNYLPVSDILAALNLSLANVSFNHIFLEGNRFSLDNINPATKNYTHSALSGDLAFEQEIKDNSISFNVLYKPDKINSYLLGEFILCYMRSFVVILNDLLKNKTLADLTHINDYKILSSKQYEEIIYTWNQTDHPCVRDKTISDIFEEQVEKTPNNVAISHEETKLTYKELNEKANRLANYLKKSYNIKPDTLITLCLDRNEHMFIAMLAVLKAGGAYVPINLTYPDERIMYILENAKTNLILTSELYKKRLDQISKIYLNKIENLVSSQDTQPLNIISLNDVALQEKLLIQSKENPDKSFIKSINLAYVIYTSGTTGKPKGVMIEQRSYVATMDCMKKLCFADEQEISTYNITNYAFDMIGPEYGLPLLTGGTVFIGTNEFDLLDCSQYDFIQMTPTLCDMKLDCLINTDNTKLFIGAESLSQDLLVRILKKSIDVAHWYGPTETTIWSTHKYYSYKENITLTPVILGKPFYNERVYVLDRNLNPLPIGTIGELYIGGVGLARGYLNRPGLTAEKFIPNPFQTREEKAKNQNTRLYKTGDLVRWLPKGNLEYIGRNDFQVKIRGYRIELGDIETALLSHDGVKQSIVIAKERLNKDGSPTGHKYLIGYYVSDSKKDEADVLNYLKSQLPEYMLPTALVCLPSLPQTINGKLDRNALPAPEFSSIEHCKAPKNEQEIKLCNIWSEVLGLSVGSISIQDDFFRLGGDSILAIRLVSKINQELKSRIKVKDIYELGCISNIIEFINSTKDNFKNDEVYLPFSLVESKNYLNDISDINLIEDIYPASYLQMRMLKESEKEKNGTYHIVSCYSVQARFEKNKLRTTLEELTHKYELLRAAFVLTKDGKYNIFIYKNVEVEYHFHTNKDSKKLITEEKLNNFDYSKPGLFRIIINDLGDNFHLILSIHHAIEDGWSMATLINDFGNAYINNKKIEPTLKLKYGEFIRNEIAACNQENINFWKKYLDNLEVVKVHWSSGKKKSGVSLYNCIFSLDMAQVSLIHKISKDLRISVDSIFLFSYLKTLSHFIEVSDITVGMVANNRLEKEDGDKLFGLFINIIPFRFNLELYSNDLKRLLGIFNKKIKLQEYKSTPYEYLRSLYNKDLYTFVFDFVHLHILGERVSAIESIDGFERTHMPFILTVAQKGKDIFNVGISAHDNFISREFLNDFAQYYKECLTEISKVVRLELSKENHSMKANQ